MKKVLFIQPHKTVLGLDLNKGDSIFLAERTDGFARAVQSLPAMTVLGSFKDCYESYFIDATADNPQNLFPFNEDIYVNGMDDSELCDRINEVKPDYLLLTSMFTTEYFMVNRILKLVKEKFNLPTIVGGHHATLRPAWHLDEGNADIIALGEGELNINSILEAVEGRISLSDVNGVAYRNNKGELIIQPKLRALSNLNQTWDIETVVKKIDGSYRYPLSIVIRNPELYMPENSSPAAAAGILYSSRGCPNACNYCNASDRDGRKIRHMGLEKTIEITEEFMAMGANTFTNQSDTFGMHPADREYLAWVGEQRKKGREINLINLNSFFAKYFFPKNKFSPERADLLKDAGFRTITVSIESFNEEFNQGKLKGITVEMLNNGFAYLKEQGLNIEAYMMRLFPGQTENELKDDLKKIERISQNINRVSMRSLTYFPGTQNYEWAINTGKFTEKSYKSMILNGHSFYSENNRFNFSNIKLDSP